MSQNQKRLLSRLLLLVLMVSLVLPLPTQAASNVLRLVYCYDASGNQLGFSTGIVGMDSDDGEIYVYADDTMLYDNAASYVLQDGSKSYNLTYKGTLDDQFRTVAFQCAELTASSSCVIAAAGAAQNQSCYFHYYDKTLTEHTASATITNYVEHTYSYQLEVQFASGFPQDAAQFKDDERMLMGALISSSGELLGFLTPSGDFVAREISPSFYGGSGGGYTPTQEPDVPDYPDEDDRDDSGAKGRGDSDSDNDSDDAKGRDDDSKNDSDDGSILEKTWFRILILAAVGGGFGALVVANSKKKKQQARTAAQPVRPAQQFQPVQQIQPHPVQPVQQAHPAAPVQPTMPIQPVTPVQPVRPVQPVQASPGRMVLMGVGGPKDGHRFSVGTAPITFGRDPSSTICFPPETKGVSRKHCQLFWHKGAWMLMDTGSSYGTFLQNKGQIAPNVPTPLRVGDTFYVGDKTNGFILREE